MADPKIVEGPGPKGPKPILGVGMIAGAVALGLVLGAAVIAPQFLGGSSAPAPAQAADHEGGDSGGDHGGGTSGGGGGGGHGGGGVEGGEVFEVDKVVVNPAGSEGRHFLLATVAVQSFDSKIDEHLREHEPLVRDVVISILGTYSMDMLGEPDAKEVIKRDLLRAIARVAGCPERELTIYLPEFVVQ